MIKLHTSTDNQFYFTVCGRNGQVVLTSETYTQKGTRNRAAASVNKKFIKPMKVVDCDGKYKLNIIMPK